MNDKALNPATLELTQKIQLHFPRGIKLDVLREWNGASAEMITAVLLEKFGKPPVVAEPKPAPSILESIGMIPMAATTAPFVSSQKFVVNTSDDAPVKISAVWDNFTNWFLAGEGRIEESIAEHTILRHRLRKNSVDGPMIAELGGVKLAMTGLTQMYSMMENQPNGPQGSVAVGPLLVTGRANIFYVPQAVTKLEGNRFSYVNKAGETVTEEVANPDYLFEEGTRWYVLRAVSVDWYGGGWNVDANSVEDPDAWDDGDRVFSRNSFESQVI